MMHSPRLADLLIVFPTFHKRIGVVEASRSWRQGVRTHVVVDDMVPLDALRAAGARHNETFSALPDLPGMPTSLRHVMAPLLAHTAHGGRYKWMLLGDDDTLFSLPAVLGLLREMRLPHTEPLAVSDFLVHCRHEASAKPGTPGAKRYTAPVTRDPRCPAAPAASATGARDAPPTPPCILSPQSTQPPRFRPHPDCPPEGRTSFYGGAGVILSHGLMQRLARHNLHAQPVLASEAAASAAGATDASFYAVAMSTYSLAGDTLMSEAWRRAGFSFTAPPPLPYELPQHSSTQRQPCAGGSGAPPAPQCRRFGSLVGFNDEASPEVMVHRHRLAAEVSPEAFRRVVSAHLRQRKANMTSYLAAMRELGALIAGASTGTGGLI
ncbi:hypothetical protein HYH02_002286 [Chlamydomonas schloesseri]|uniref:Hexosyltransferase n=1 Tax=Chlamydomonas schloesseri TaxID=2026947 RepID=A0A836BBJ3_9CHLO|nr:hypothetical protein HYH02_002286 [Chlamydomonas schloesseri]|eukprot:KAG2452949.1 hypothetical protein HYH02_002286 [Chlamydomonas schloesseri]